MKQKEEQWRVSSVGKALEILNLFNSRRTELSLAQVSQEMNIPKSTAYNLLRTMESEQYLRKADNLSNYIPGVRLLELGYCARNSMSIISYAIPVLEDITKSTGEITYLSTVHGDNLLVLEGTYPERRFATYTTGGKSLPLNTCSAGKMILSTLPDSVIEQFASRGLVQSTINTIRTLDVLMEEMHNIRTKGYSVDNEEETMGVRCASVAIYGSTGRAVGAVSISGSVRSITDEAVKKALPYMDKAAHFLSRIAYAFPAVYPDDVV
ncbi:MAG: IclR family transcriptional regulator [Clostridiales bacterium]|nr:IclR family transcriptional regulator [Clostridiales bacterium]